MRPLLSLLLPILLCFACPAAAGSAHERRIERFGVYVVVADLDRARAFYETLFGEPPYVTTPALVGFDVEGGLYALVAARVYRPNVRRGDNAIPYLRVRDIDAEFERVRQIAPNMLDQAVVAEGPIRLFRFTDPDGNMIEFFSLPAVAPR